MKPDKIKLIRLCIQLIEQKISGFIQLQSDLFKALQNETKSSAGDKHETSRAMLQLEQEKLGKQVHEWELNLGLMHKLLHAENTQAFSSLYITDKGTFFLSCNLGKIQFEGSIIYALSPESPLGKLLREKNRDEKVTFLNSTYLIIDKY
jgi:hypothetical protein